MKAGEVKIYVTEKKDPYFLQFNNNKVILLEPYLGDLKPENYRWYVRDGKSGIQFYASLNELKDK